MTEHEIKMRKLEKEGLVLDCIKIRFSIRPWFTQDNSMLKLMTTMGQRMQDHPDFPNRIKPANLETLNQLKLELAYRN